MSKTTKLNFETIESPYNDNLDRGEEEMDSLADKTGLFRTSGTSEFASEVDKEVSGQDLTDLWISSWIKSRGYKPKTSGFLLDGKRGYIECMKLYVGDGGIEGGSIHIPNETADDSFHSNSYGDSWWGCNVADLAANVDNAKAYILKTGQAKFQNAAVEGTSTIDGRAATVLSAAIDASGHFADNAINTAAGTILADFTFGASGAIQIGSYVNGVSGDIKISPSGILGRNSSGATTFSINGTTGVAVLNGLVVGTNVGLGTAQDSAGVTTIIGNTVTTGYVNALNITAQYVVASISISSPTITGGTIQTSTSGDRVVMTNDVLKCYKTGDSYPRTIIDSDKLFLSAGDSSWLTGYTTNIFRTTDYTYIQHDGSGINAEIRLGAVVGNPEEMQLAGSFYPKTDNLYNIGESNTTRRWNNLYLSGNISVNGTVDGIDIASHAGNVSAHHNSQCYNIWMQPNGVTSHSYMRPDVTNSYDLGTSSYFWQDLYLNNKIYFGSISYYLKHDGNVFKINDDLQPIADGSKRLGYTNMAWYAVHSDNYLGCNLPASKSGIDIFKKIKSPKLKDGKAKGYHAGKRHYFEINEFPDEMKMIDKDSEKKDIELTRTLGVTVSAVRELVETIDNLTNRLIALENK